MKLGIGNDHSAVDMKLMIKEYLEEMGHEVIDYGTNDRGASDYPIQGKMVAKAVASGEVERGIVICGTGIGISLAANKVKGIRCAVCSEPYSAKLSRIHNDANMLAFGARVVGSEMAKYIVKEWMEAEYAGSERHVRRINMLMAIEEEQ